MGSPKESAFGVKVIMHIRKTYEGQSLPSVDQLEVKLSRVPNVGEFVECPTFIGQVEGVVHLSPDTAYGAAARIELRVG